MNKCNNCAKFLTCNRKECDQVTFLQAGQIDKIEPELLEKSANTLEEDIDYIINVNCQFGITIKEALEEEEEYRRKFIEMLKEEGKWIEK